MARSPEQIRESIARERAELAVDLVHLRQDITFVMDWRGHLRRHRREVVLAAAAAGFVLGGGIAGIVGLFRSGD